jgi:anthranilate phosphoribosyltransferase
MVVWGRDNMDEVSLGAATIDVELVNLEIRKYDIHQEDLGMQMIASRNLKVAGADESKEKIFEALANRDGPAREIVVLNAATALYAAGIATSVADGIAKARDTIASGAARAKLEQFVRVTQQLGGA